MKIIFICIGLLLPLFSKDYSKNAEVQQFINQLVEENSFNKIELERLFSNVQNYESALRVFKYKKKRKRNREQKTYYRYGSWDRYSRLKINASRVKQGVQFIKKHQEIFDNVEKQYGVPKEYLTAIIGVETNYGGHLGNYLVFDNLVTLAFEKNRRNTFFKKELEKFMLLSKKQQFNPRDVKGSYAGAIGLGQFMPSNYEAYGVDYNDDGKVTLLSAGDAIASIANYFKKNRWKTGEPVATRVRYEGNRFHTYKTGYKKTYDRKNLMGISPRKEWNYKGKVRLIKLDKKNYDELWYGAKNFFVITRYNHSAYYAMSVHLLAQKIKANLESENQ